MRRLKALVAGLRQHGKQVVVVAPVPLPGYNIASIAARSLAFHGRTDTPTAMSRADYLAEYANVLAAMDALEREPGVRVVHIDRLVCHGGQCPFVVGGRAAFADYGHYATWFAARLGPAFSPALDAAPPR